MKTITVKLTGAPAALAGVRLATLELPDAATFADLVEKLAALHPILVNLVIDPGCRSLLSSNFFQRSELDFILDGMWDIQPKDGEQVTLVSPITGG